jgi:DNA adenine methylase
MAVSTPKLTMPTGRLEKPFLNWAGNKRHIAKHILQLQIPEFQRYHEPFLGSGAFFLALSSICSFPKAFLSDRNQHLTSMFLAIKNDPESVIRSLKLHILLDSDIHFSGVLGELNNNLTGENADPAHAAGVIYVLAQSFHSSWYETPDGHISLSRRSNPKPFNPHFDRISAASLLLNNAEICTADFKESMNFVSPNDLVFVDPPYLSEEDKSDRRAYTAKRFDQGDLAELTLLIEQAVFRGAHVIFCWGGELKGSVFDIGEWFDLGKTSVWMSFSGDCRSSTKREQS